MATRKVHRKSHRKPKSHNKSKQGKSFPAHRQDATTPSHWGSGHGTGEQT